MRNTSFTPKSSSNRAQQAKHAVSSVEKGDVRAVVENREKNIEKSNKEQQAYHGESTIRGVLEREYAKKDNLPKILEDDTSTPQKIENTYVNLMLIESGNTVVEERANGSYEDIRAKKIEIGLENIFDSKVQPDKSVKIVNKVLLYGRAGIGKTTLCNYISYKWSNGKLWAGKFDYVFWLPLRNLNGDWYKGPEKYIDKYALECFIGRYCLGRDKSFSVQDISEVIKKGKILIILDGYDEIVSFHNEKNTIIKDVIDDAIEITNKQAKVIMTSRPNAVSHSIIDKFDTEIENSGLKKENVYEYIEKYKFQEAGRREGLARLVKQYAHIEAIAQVPINLYLLCWMYDKASLSMKEHLTVTELYEKITLALFKKYLEKHKSKNIKTMRDSEVLNQCIEECEILEKLAYSGILGKTAILSKKLIEENGITGTQLEEIRNLGLLPAIGKSDKLVYEDHEFIHLTFQEYFAAKCIVRVLGSGKKEEIKKVVEFLNENKYNRVYERVILFIAGLVTLELEKNGNKQAMRYFWDMMLNVDVDLGAIKQLGLLIRCLEEGKCNKDIPGIDKILEVIKQYSLQHFDQFKQSLNMSTQVLCKSGVVENLIGKVRNKEGLTTYTYALALGELKVDDVRLAKAMVKALCEALKDPDAWAAARALERLKLGNAAVEKAVVEVLCEALKDPDVRARKGAADALRNLKLAGPEVVESLCEALVDCNHDKGVRIAAAYALGQLKLDDVGLTEAVVALDRALEDHDKDVCKAAISVLVQLKLDDMKLAKKVAIALCKALEDPNELVRRDAVNALEKLKPDNIELAKAVVSGLCSVADSTNKGVRCDAITALDKLKPDYASLARAVAGILVKILKEDPDEWMRRNAADALGKLKLDGMELAEDVAVALCRALEDPSAHVCSSAAYALRKLRLDDLGLEVVVKALLRALKNPNAGIRQVTASALGKLTSNDAVLIKEVILRLCEALKDPDKYVRINAASALVKLHPYDMEIAKTAVEALCNALEDSNDWVSMSACNALKELELCNVEVAKAVATRLCKAIENPNRNMRIHAAEALRESKLGDVEAEVVAGLSKVLTNRGLDIRDREVHARYFAAAGFRKLKLNDAKLSETVTKTLCQILKDPKESGDLRITAADTLRELKLADAKVARAVAAALREALEGPKEWLRQAAARALGELLLDGAELEKTVASLCTALRDRNQFVCSAAASALGQLKLDGVGLAKAVEALCNALDHTEEWVRNYAAFALGKLKPDGIGLAEIWLALLHVALVSTSEYMCSLTVHTFKTLKMESEDLQEKVVKSLLTEFRDSNKVAYKNALYLLKRIEVVGRKAQQKLAEALIENLSLANRQYDYQDILNRALEKCAIDNIELPFKRHSIKLLNLRDLNIMRESAIVLSDSCLTLHYGDHKLEFKLDPSDKKLPLKILKHFHRMAERKGLPTAMLSQIITGSKWIETGEAEVGKLCEPKRMELTALHIAASEGNKDKVVEILNKKEIDIDDQNNEERDTALMIAVRKRHRKVAEVLVEAGADIAFCNKLGFNAINIADSNSADIVPYLINKCFVKEFRLDKLLSETARAYEQAQSGDIRDEIIVQLTRCITGCNKAENWRTNLAIKKQYRMYCENMLNSDMDHDTSQVQPIKSGKVVAGNPDVILSMRLYIFVELYIKIAIGHTYNFPGGKADALRNIRKEIRIISDGIINENIGKDVIAVIALSSQENQLEAINFRVNGIISRLKLMPRGDEFVINSGYDGNPGHAIYIALHKLSDREILVRVDNRYLNCDVVRQEHGKAQYITEKDGKRFIKPYCVGIFSLDNVQELVSYLAEALKIYCRLEGAVTKSDINQICSHIYGASLSKRTDIPDEINKYIDSWPLHPQQTTKGMNCIISSYNMGIETRHGKDFFGWLREAELEWVPTITPAEKSTSVPSIQYNRIKEAWEGSTMEQTLVALAGVYTSQASPSFTEESVGACFLLNFSNITEHQRFVLYYRRKYAESILQQGAYQANASTKVVLDMKILYEAITPDLEKYREEHNLSNVMLSLAKTLNVDFKEVYIGGDAVERRLVAKAGIKTSQKEARFCTTACYCTAFYLSFASQSEHNLFVSYYNTNYPNFIIKHYPYEEAKLSRIEVSSKSLLTLIAPTLDSSLDPQQQPRQPRPKTSTGGGRFSWWG